MYRVSLGFKMIDIDYTTMINIRILVGEKEQILNDKTTPMLSIHLRAN